MIVSAKPIRPLSIATFVILAIACVVACVALVASAVVIRLKEVEQSFVTHSEEYAERLNRSMVSNEAILIGFAALFDAVGSTEPETVSRYVQRVLQNNKQVFTLEISQRVDKEHLAEFVAAKRKSGAADFKVKSFSYESDRTWTEPQDKPFYYPIVFMEPRPAGGDEILGLDMESVPFLKAAMLKAIQLNGPVSSEPFRLVEGNQAYVVFCPVQSNSLLIVDMVIDIAKLPQPESQVLHDGFHGSLRRRDLQQSESKGILFSGSGPVRSAIEVALFPRFDYQKSLVTMDETLYLNFSKQTGWSDLNKGAFALIGFMSVLTIVFVVAYLRSVQSNRRALIQNQDELWRLANHDPLTGIPNRMLMTDRLVQAMAASERSGEFGAIIFLDMDHFKSLNDTKGHEMGDLLLVEAAKRIKECIRDVDTVARFGGDEFVAILSDLGHDPDESKTAANKVAEKICVSLSDPFKLREFEYRTSASKGISMFLGNQPNFNELIKSADAEMYKDKAQTHQRQR
jgi:diguanylate cyclase (GGDEF)-like protein